MNHIRYSFCVGVAFQTLPAAFLHIAQGLKEPKLRSDYRKRLLALCSDVSSSVESTSGRLVYLVMILPALLLHQLPYTQVRCN